VFIRFGRVLWSQEERLQELVGLYVSVRGLFTTTKPCSDLALLVVIFQSTTQRKIRRYQKILQKPWKSTVLFG